MTDRLLDYEGWATQQIHDLQREVERLRLFEKQAWRLVEEGTTLREALDKYGDHDRDCILSKFEAGEPTPDGGYRHKLAGKWYDAKALPECECGFDKALAATEA